MNKQAILDAVSQALDGMGMPMGEVDDYGEMADAGDNTMPIWSQLKAGTPLGQGGGAIHNKDDLLGMDRTSKPPMVDNYGMPVDDDQDEMMVAMGLI